MIKCADRKRKSIIGEAWTLTVAGESQQLLVVTDLSALAAEFAAWINANANLAEYSALAEDNVLLVVKRTAGSFETTLTVNSAGIADTTPSAVPSSG